MLAQRALTNRAITPVPILATFYLVIGMYLAWGHCYQEDKIIVVSFLSLAGEILNSMTQLSRTPSMALPICVMGQLRFPLGIMEMQTQGLECHRGHYYRTPLIKSNCLDFTDTPTHFLKTQMRMGPSVLAL